MNRFDCLLYDPKKFTNLNRHPFKNVTILKKELFDESIALNIKSEKENCVRLIVPNMKSASSQLKFKEQERNDWEMQKYCCLNFRSAQVDDSFPAGPKRERQGVGLRLMASSI